MMPLYRTALGLTAVAVLHTTLSAQTGFRDVIDHIHIAAPDPTVAVAWYRDNFGGQPAPEADDRVMIGEVRLIVAKNEKGEPSAGSSIDHFAFGVSDVDATLRTLQTRGGKIAEPARETGGVKTAFVDDPWGTRLELLQDPSRLGLHHIHLRTPDPAAALKWYADTFGGRPGRFRNSDGVEFGGVWILSLAGPAPPSQGHAIDHIGFRPVNVDAAIANLKTKNVKVTAEPRDLTRPNGMTSRIAFVESPTGIRIELVQR